MPLYHVSRGPIMVHMGSVVEDTSASPKFSFDNFAALNAMDDLGGHLNRECQRSIEFVS